MNRPEKWLLAGAALAAPAAATASETVTYSYDALGRLVAVSTSGTVNDGLNVSTGYDPAGNRCEYIVNPTGPAAAENCAGWNQPPVAANDSGNMTRCADKSFAVLGNDLDPDDHLPLALVSVSGGEARGTAAISGTSIVFSPIDITGTAVVTYVMGDSAGATDSATLTITITNGTCPDPQLIEGAEG